MILIDLPIEREMIQQQSVTDEGDEKHSLYLRFPKKLNADRTLAESEVKSLNSKIIRVRIPWQRSANFCLVDFASGDDKEKALKKLKKVEINDKRLVVKEATRSNKDKIRKKIEKVQVKREVNEALGKLVADMKNSLTRKYAKHNVPNGVAIRALKANTTLGDIRKVFPQAIDIKLNVKSDRKNSFALVWLPTPKEAKEAASNSVQINGEEYEVNLENDGKRIKRKQRNNSTGSGGGGDDDDDTESSSDEGSILEDDDDDGVDENGDSDDEVNEDVDESD